MLRPLVIPDGDGGDEDTSGGDVAYVLALNQRFVPHVSPLDATRLRLLVSMTAYAEMVELDGAPAGFVLTFPPGTAYDSENYRWFSERFPEGFLYLDRIAIDERFHRRGLGSFVYDRMEREARAWGRLVCEVNTVPVNDSSLAFHAARGYVEIGRLAHSNGTETAMLVKELGRD